MDVGVTPYFFFFVFIRFMDVTGGLSRWRLVLRDRAASHQGPGHLAVLTGSSLHGGPQML